MSTFYQKEMNLTNVRIKKIEKFILTNLSQALNYAIWRRFLIILILTRYEHPHQKPKRRACLSFWVFARIDSITRTCLQGRKTLEIVRVLPRLGFCPNWQSHEDPSPRSWPWNEFESCHFEQIWLWEANSEAFFFAFTNANFEGWRFCFVSPLPINCSTNWNLLIRGSIATASQGTPSFRFSATNG